jgi:Zn-dependent M32 family carboxypeptidase
VPEAGRWLRSNIFEKGALLRWDALVENATGRTLSAEDLARDLTA